MAAYVVRRLLFVPVTVFAAVSLLFVLFFVLPGEPAQLIAGGYDRPLDADTKARIEARYDLDRPVLEQFTGFWGRTIRGDLGESFVNRRPVRDIVEDRTAASLRLAFWAMVLEVLMGVGIGAAAAVRRGSWGDRATMVSAAVLAAVPVFVLGYLLQYGLAVLPAKHGWPEALRVRTQGIGPDSWALGVIPVGEQWRYLLLPAVTLAASSAALALRVTRSSMLEVLRADYVRTARAKGLSERRVVLGHGLRNAMLPVVTLLGVDFGVMLGAAVLTEKVFGWPGIGSAIATAVDGRDMPVMLGLTVVVVLAYAIVNLLVDLSYSWLDPRVRSGRGVGS